MRGLRFVILLLGLLGVVVGDSGCTPTYPKCDKDTDCPGNAKGKEWCVNGQCQQCRPGRNDCPAGYNCNAGRCDTIPGYCTSNDQCPNGGVCVNNRCNACQTDGQCGKGRCQQGRCVAETRTACKGNEDCKESEDCVNGFCTPANRQSFNPVQGGGCTLETVYFDFNMFVLSAESTAAIDRNAQCVKSQNRSVNLIGRTDPRGTTEYNLALSEKRAQAVRDRMLRLGVESARVSTLPRGKLDATGTDETTWARDRNVEFQWR